MALLHSPFVLNPFVLNPFVLDRAPWTDGAETVQQEQRPGQL
ncbi:hypothetical protein QIS99_01165 [Streptomyces sp. B-S-A8]|uniref:Uncharacterized protein n=1 Tax=Streptomyces solicavernae TaxID=3043614 RepID=A0ABT6RM68_9ACTN|nr:hypothetical protein [Streptomyces sp. B-S-A8]MDI3384833.1 hypothetical protein [Streptomyces sp. B-S-A8]